MIGRLILVAAAGLSLAGCGMGGSGRDDAGLPGVAGQVPRVTLPGTAPGSGVRIKVLSEGTGPVTRPGQVIVTNVEITDWQGDRHLLGTYDTEQPTTISLDGSHVAPTWARALVGRHAGSRVLLVAPATEGFGPGGRAPAGVTPSDTLIDVFDIVGGYAPDAQVVGGGAVGVDGAGRGPAPVALVSRVLVAGTGPRVRPGGIVVVQYVGTRWRDGSVFDSSYSRGGPNGFELRPGAVVPGWVQGLTGRRVGSRVLLEVPERMERGHPPTPGGVAAPDDNDVYVIDILGASGSLTAEGS